MGPQPSSHRKLEGTLGQLDLRLLVSGLSENTVVLFQASQWWEFVPAAAGRNTSTSAVLGSEDTLGGRPECSQCGHQELGSVPALPLGTD